MNKICCGDNLEIMEKIKPETIDLIYLDPPFFSGRNYEIIWGDEARGFEDTKEHFTEENAKNKVSFAQKSAELKQYDERMEGGISTYLVWMSRRLRQMHRILKPTGSIYLHCDSHASHYLKIEMDKIFGYNNFQNEIVWHYTGGLNAKKNYPTKHDSIFLYSKEENFTFNIQREPYAETSGYAKGGIVSAAGKKYEPNPEGKPIDDVWNIPIINPMAKERLGYPTQKPEALLERIIKASSNEGDIVLDPFCGCGTAIAVAKRLNRKYIGIDVSPKACKLMAERLGLPEDSIRGMPQTMEQLKAMTPHAFQQWVCGKMSAINTSKHKDKPSGGDGGKDGVVSSFDAGKYDGSPIQVKQSEGVGVNTVKNLFATMSDMGVDNGFIVAFSFGAGAHEQIAKYKLDDRANIKLITVDKLIEVDKYQYPVTKLTAKEAREIFMEEK